MACNCKDKNKCKCKEERQFAIGQTTVGIKEIIPLPAQNAFIIRLTNLVEYFIQLPAVTNGVDGIDGKDGKDGVDGLPGPEGTIDLEQINLLLDGQLEELAQAIEELASDELLTPAEKLILRVEVNKIKSQYPTIYGQADASGLESLKAQYEIAYNELILYIEPILEETGNTTINKTTFTERFNQYYLLRATIQLQIMAIIKSDAEQARETAEGVAQINNFWEITIDEEHGLIAAGTLLVGTPTRNNAGLTGVTEDGEDSVRLWAGGTYANRQNAPVQIRDGGGFWLGSNVKGLDWHITNPNTLTIRGALIQDSGGNSAEIVVFRGDYNPEATYYKGNTVRYQGSVFYYKNDIPKIGVTPVEGIDWTVYVAKGEDGTVGTPGAPGTSSYFHVAYADSDDGQTNFNQVGGAYIGTYVDSNPTDSNDPADYNWVLIKGLDGENGIPGVDGSNGETSYLHLKYSNDGGVTFTGNNGEDVGTYLGQYVDFTLADSADPSDYKWALIKGADGLPGTNGQDGVQGPPGNDGLSTYFHIAYANSADGSVGFNQVGGSYIGTYVDSNPIDSGTYSDYTWRLFKGQDGEQGIPGTNGDDGLTSYLHIKYSNDGGATFTASNGEVAGTYIGQYVDFNIADSTNPAQYVWALIKGADGDPGTPGAPGADGKFTEFRFAKNGSTSSPPSISSSDAEPSGWTIAQPTLAPLEYLWMSNVIKNADGTLVTTWSTPVRQNGADGADGSQGATGAQGPFVLGRGVWSASKEYVGSSTRVEVVQYSGVWYVSRTDAGAIPIGNLPTDTNNWNVFGGQFESVATSLLFAQMAYIDNLGVRTLKTKDTGRRITINDNDDNSFKAYHENGNIGIQIGTDLNGLAIMTAYNSNGIKVWDLNQTGIVYVNTVNESWVDQYFRIVPYYTSPLDQQQINQFEDLMGDTYGHIDGWYEIDTDDNFVVTSNLTSYLYDEGSNTNSPSNAQYKGHHTSQLKDLGNFLPTGWYIYAGIQPEVPSDPTKVRLTLFFIENGIMQLPGTDIDVQKQ